jgi:hypothetical protein
MFWPFLAIFMQVHILNAIRASYVDMQQQSSNTNIKMVTILKSILQKCAS